MPATHPPLSVPRQAPARHQAMDVWVVDKCLAPGVKHGYDANSGFQVLWVGSQLKKSLCACPKKDFVELLLIL